MNNHEYNFLSYILEKNKRNEPFTQREIAKALNISLGMLNLILKKAVNTGLIKISKINKKTYSYILTKEGLNAIYKRSLTYFKSIAKNAYIYKDAIMRMLKEKRDKGIRNVFLFGKSQLDFIVEYCCIKLGLIYKNINYKDIESLIEDKYFFEEAKCSFYMFSENLSEEELKKVLESLKYSYDNEYINSNLTNIIDFINDDAILKNID
ncbi:MAG: winged helix-turn-helix transcriptional regulator [Spirochaetes bacterium]|nr:winged helix-turn-helix transcriptional regulator [Spirochaetota bacterium]